MSETRTGRNGHAAMRIAMMLCVGHLMLGVLACREQQAKEAEETAVTQLVRDLKEHHDVTVSVTTGTEHFGKGLVELSVRGDGSVMVNNRRSGKERDFTGKLDADQLAALGPELASAGFATLRSPGPPRAPGDTPVVLGVAQGSRQRYHAELWYGDRYEMPGLDKIIKRHDAIVTKFTNGELPY